MPNDVMAEVDELKKRLAQNPDSLIFVPLADAYRKAGMFEDAIEVCKKGLEKHPAYMSARVVLGRIYNEKEMLDEAVEELKKVEAVDVDNIMVHSMLGNVYIKKKMYAQAVEQFQRVLSLNPEDTETQEKLQEALSAKQSPAAPAQNKKNEETKTEVPKAEGRKAEALKTENPKSGAHKAEDRKENAPAAKAENIKPAEDKIDVQKMMRAAELYTKKEEFNKALEIYKELLDKEPGNVMLEQRMREVYDFQDKKMQKLKAKPAEPARKVNADKITTEDILDAMKKAVEEDRVDEEPVKPPEIKIEAEKEVEQKAETKDETRRPEAAAEKESEPETAAEQKPQAPVKTAVKVDPAKAKQLEAVLKDLNNVDGIEGSLFLQRDGSIIASVLPKGIHTEDIGNFIAPMVEKTEESVKAMDQGKLRQVVISSESGTLLFTEVSAGVLFMIGNEQINLGKMRLILKDVIANIKGALV
jgi:predicted regulator of Ras-like GTPase activity (Roadblock/LC7/MglB family)/lipopolysaccharide biosynthesis regulator YciM